VTPTHSLVLRLLRSDELEEAAQLVGRGMRDNPSNMTVFRIPDRERRSIAMGLFSCLYSKVSIAEGLFLVPFVLTDSLGSVEWHALASANPM